MERTNLALAIQHVLIQTGNAVLPGIGVLRLMYHPARLNRQEGKIYPPSEIPEFEVLEDLSEPEPGLLHEFLQTLDETDETIGMSRLQQVFSDIKAALGRGEEVELPEVGDFFVEDGQIRFRPGPFNYYLEVFGLGPVQARPVMRRTPEQAARIAQESRAKLLLDAKAPIRSRRKDRYVLSSLAAVLILALAGCIWLILTQPSAPADPALSATAQDAGLEMPDEDTPRTDPGDLTDQLLGQDPDTVTQPREAERMGGSALVQPEEEVADVSSTVGQVRIITGHFANPDNVEGLMNRLERMNLRAFSEPGKGGLIRVFVLVDPGSSDPANVLALIRKEVEPTAWISE